VLLDGDARARPRSHASIYVYFAAVQPLIQQWAADRGHLREVTAADIKAVLDPLRGHQLRTTTVAVRSLFRFAKKRGLVFANPAARLKAADPGGSLLPMTDAEIRAVEQAATSPAQRLIVALAAIHAARWAAIRDLSLDDGPSARFAYRRLGPRSGVPLIMAIRARGTIDHWDPALMDKLSPERDVIMFDNRGTGRSSGPATAQRRGAGGRFHATLRTAVFRAHPRDRRAAGRFRALIAPPPAAIRPARRLTAPRPVSKVGVSVIAVSAGS
jgi:hypothetical protein